MTTTAYILIFIVLLLGAGIAAVGDRVGSRVGKARLTLFNLRPRKTALLVTVFTGSFISAATLLLLFAASERFRTGVFELKRIENKLSRTRKEVNVARGERDEVQKLLEEGKLELEESRHKLRTAAENQARTEARLKKTRAQFNAVFQQARTLRNDIQQMRVERQGLLQQRQQLIQQRQQVEARLNAQDREITARDRAIAQKENRLEALEPELARRERELDILNERLGRILTGNVALQRGQPLAAGVVRVIEPGAAVQAVDQLLRDANCVAIERTQPGNDCKRKRVVQITEAQVRQLIARIDDGQDYVVRILSAGNYVTGEKMVQVFAVSELNQQVFSAGDLVASIALEAPQTLPEQAVEQRIEQLLAVVQFQGRRAGMINNIPAIADGRAIALIRFLEQLKLYPNPLEIQAIAIEDSYTFGPLRIDLVAIHDGKVAFRTTHSQSSGEQGTGNGE